MPQTQNQKKAADAVAAWLARREHNYAWLSEEAGVDPGTVGDFLNNERWPKDRTQAKIETALGWPNGTIRQIGRGDPIDIVWATGTEVTLDYAPRFSQDAPQDAPQGDLHETVAALQEKVIELARRVNRLEEESVDVGVALAARRTRSGGPSAGQQKRRQLAEAGEDDQSAQEDET